MNTSCRNTPQEGSNRSVASINHDTDNAVVNPYIPPSLRNLKSKIAALDDNEYRYQIAQTCLYFPNDEEQLQQLCRDANSLPMDDSELGVIRQRNQSQVARASFEQLKESLQIHVVSRSSWRTKYPKDWMKFGGRDLANSRMGEYRRYVANLMKWGLLHNDDKIKHHFTKYRCPCTGKDFSTYGSPEDMIFIDWIRTHSQCYSLSVLLFVCTCFVKVRIMDFINN